MKTKFNLKLCILRYDFNDQNQPSDPFRPITGFVYLQFGTRILHVERPYWCWCYNSVTDRSRTTLVHTTRRSWPHCKPKRFFSKARQLGKENSLVIQYSESWELGVFVPRLMHIHQNFQVSVARCVLKSLDVNGP